MLIPTQPLIIYCRDSIAIAAAAVIIGGLLNRAAQKAYKGYIYPKLLSYMLYYRARIKAKIYNAWYNLKRRLLTDIIDKFLCVRYFLGHRTLPRRREWLMDLLLLTSFLFLWHYWKIMPFTHYLKLLIKTLAYALVLFKIPATMHSHCATRTNLKIWYGIVATSLSLLSYHGMLFNNFYATF